MIATAPFEQVLAQPANRLPQLLSLRISELGRMGNLPAVAGAAEKLRELGYGNPDRLYNAACGYSLCVGIIETPPVGGIFVLPLAEPGTLSTEEQVDRQKHLELALETLKAAVAAGYKDVNHLQHDTDLVPLRPLPEFQEIMKSLSASGKLP
jgi:hypothetical protein